MSKNVGDKLHEVWSHKHADHQAQHDFHGRAIANHETALGKATHDPSGLIGQFLKAEIANHTDMQKHHADKMAECAGKMAECSKLSRTIQSVEADALEKRMNEVVPLNISAVAPTRPGIRPVLREGMMPLTKAADPAINFIFEKEGENAP